MSGFVCRVELRRVAVAAALTASVALAWGTSAAQAAVFAYVMNGASAPNAAISEYIAGSNGALNPLVPPYLGPPSDGLFVPTSTWRGKDVYVTSFTGNRIYQYNAATDGVLTPKSPPTIDVDGDATAGIVVDPDDRYAYAFVYSADPAKNGIVQFSIGSDGTLTQVGQVLTTNEVSTVLKISPDGKSLYSLVGATAGYIEQFDIGAGGAVSPKSQATVGAGFKPSSMAISPNGKYAYSNNDNSPFLFQWVVNADGTLSPNTTPTVVVPGVPATIAISPDGSSLYGTDFAHDAVEQFTIAADGTLTPKSPTSVAVNGSVPIGLAISYDGLYAYVTNTLSDTVEQRAISTDGVLSTMGTTTPTGGQPNIILVTDSERPRPPGPTPTPTPTPTPAPVCPKITARSQTPKKRRHRPRTGTWAPGVRLVVKTSSAANVSISGTATLSNGRRVKLRSVQDMTVSGQRRFGLFTNSARQGRQLLGSRLRISLKTSVKSTAAGCATTSSSTQKLSAPINRLVTGR